MKHGPLSAYTAFKDVNVFSSKVFLQLVEFEQKFILLLFNHHIFRGLFDRRLIYLHFGLIVL